MQRRTAVLVSLLAGCAVSDVPPPAERLETAASSIVGGSPSVATDDFIVFVSQKKAPSGQPGENCGGSLVAPNLVLTAKHCVYPFIRNSTSICDATGEPQPGAEGGYVSGTYPLDSIVLYTGAEARGRYFDDVPPDAFAKRLVDDRTTALCSHDLAFVLLDRAITDRPVAQLRLGARPRPGEKLTLAGWGRIESGSYSRTRLRRPNMGIQRVGPPIAVPNATGSLGPATFETGPGGCSGDSGGPGFLETTSPSEGARPVVGVLARALNLDMAVPNPCAAESVVDVFMTVADFPDVVREAFEAAGAEPWIAGHAAAGYAQWGEACRSDLECKGALCVGATETTSGTCNVACTKGRVCPEGHVCAANGSCEMPPPAPPPPPPITTTPPPPPPPPPPPEEPEIVRASSCAFVAVPGRGGDAALSIAALALLACGRRARRIRLDRSS